MDAIYREHGKMIYHYLLSLGADTDLAEELAQETFYQALKGIKNFRGESVVSTWLCSIARNQYYSYLKKNLPTEELTENFPANESVAWETKETLRIIHQLPNPGKEIVYLRLISDLGFREIGEIMGQTETWARVNFYRAKQKIMEELNGTD